MSKYILSIVFAITMPNIISGDCLPDYLDAYHDASGVSSKYGTLWNI